MTRQCRTFICALLLGLSMPLCALEPVVRVTNGEWPPYLGERLPHFGIASRIVTEAFKRQGIAVQYGFFPWRRALLLANTPDWDGAAVWLKSAERERDFYFSDPVIDSDYVFFHLKAVPFSWTSVDDLSRYRLGITNEYFYGPAFMAALSQGKLLVEGVPSDEQNFRKLLGGRIDAFPMDRIVGLTMLQQNFSPQELSRVTFTRNSLHSQPLHLLLTKRHAQNRVLLQEFNQGLKKLKASGQVDAYLKEALGPEVVR